MNTDARTKIETRLREADLKLTPQRFAVLDYLVRSDVHPTADQISAGLNRRFPRASRATVYNTLNALRDAGLVHEIYMDDAVARYDANLDPHHHFVCRACARIEDVPADALRASLSDVTPGAGYRVESYEVVMRGVCAACSRQRQA
jgi:Fur family ferric uptake transcriptional regulator/Fur family peroxide stress response transcriptional regulator